MDYLISVQDILMGFAYVIGCAIGVLLILSLLKLLKILKKVDVFVNENEPHFSNIAQALPQTLHSIKDGVDSIKNTVDSASSALGLVESDGKDTVSYHMERIARIVELTREVIQFVVGFFSRR